jgi:BirA family biotin operon repressor/biotin-[acetyl-CoA-carboxylase] ligase
MFEKYKMTETVEKLDPKKILIVVGDDLTPEIIVFGEVGSLMDEAAKLSPREKNRWTVIVAEEQTEGRGRRSRAWYSPRSLGLYFTALLPETLLDTTPSKLPFITALATVETLQTAGCADVSIKWPNDIITDKKKIAGILIEKPARVNTYILGIGINVHHRPGDFPPDLRESATSIFLETGGDISRNVLAGSLLKNINRKIKELVDSGETAILAAYISLCETLGKKVEVLNGTDTISGTAETVAPDGSLIIRTAKGQKKVYAGDVGIIY